MDSLSMSFRLILILGLTLSLGSASCQNAPLPTAKENKNVVSTQCKDLPFFYGAPDKKDVNIRSGPGISFPIVGAVPPDLFLEKEGLSFSAGFTVTGSKDGWFSIKNASDDETLVGKKARQIYAGKGWIHGSQVQAVIQTRKAFKEPNEKSPIVKTFDADFTAEPGPIRFKACSGEWVLVEAENYKEKAAWTGWVRGVCGLQETSCEGLIGD
jgi:hypothetical protein